MLDTLDAAFNNSMSAITLSQGFVKFHRAQADPLRLGQRFWNMFCKQPELPRLFYMEDEDMALGMIFEHLMENSQKHEAIKEAICEK